MLKSYREQRSVLEATALNNSRPCLLQLTKAITNCYFLKYMFEFSVKLIPHILQVVYKCYSLDIWRIGVKFVHFANVV